VKKRTQDSDHTLLFSGSVRIFDEQQFIHDQKATRDADTSGRSR
jgi:hypothetical protein